MTTPHHYLPAFPAHARQLPQHASPIRGRRQVVQQCNANDHVEYAVAVWQLQSVSGAHLETARATGGVAHNTQNRAKKLYGWATRIFFHNFSCAKK